LVLRAGAEQLSPEEERRAIEELCRTYWYPLYSFIRRKGHNAEAAEDLTQGFFEQLLERKSFAVANQDRGRFRTFLLSALSNFLTSAWEHARCQKRGGENPIVSLDAVLAEERYALEPATAETPERAFDRRWVEALLAAVLARVRAEAEAAGDGARFDRLKGYLVEDKGAGTFADLGRELGMTEAAIKGVVRRMRARFRELLREEVAHTVGSRDDVESELRHLLGAM
jgi:RNA polymerase sigma-70 factor (ECF subfamily)